MEMVRGIGGEERKMELASERKRKGKEWRGNKSPEMSKESSVIDHCY